MPPANPSTVFSGLTLGAMRRRPKHFPKTYCATSLSCVISSRKTTHPIAPPAGFDASGTCSSSAMWLRLKTVSSTPRFALAAARRKPSALRGAQQEERQRREREDRNRTRRTRRTTTRYANQYWTGIAR